MTTKGTKILVHVCCAACASHVFKELDKSGFSPVAFFYHPEIDDKEEYDKRLADIKNLCTEDNVALIDTKFQPKEFWSQITPFTDKDSIKFINDKDRYRRRRCQLCTALLVQKTVEEAKKLKIKYFTLTNLCSPYKDHEEIIVQANEKALDYRLNFYYQDFRKGYWNGRNYARNHGIYLSNRCGCNESFKERILE